MLTHFSSVFRKFLFPTGGSFIMTDYLQGMTGTGLLALPHAFSLAGIVGGPLYMVTVATIALISMNFLLSANHQMCRVEELEFMDYGDLAESALRRGPLKFLRTRSYLGKFSVNLLLILTQLGFCAVYFVFFAETVQSLMVDLGCEQVIDKRLLITMWLLPVILICLIRSLGNHSYSFLTKPGSLTTQRL